VDSMKVDAKTILTAASIEVKQLPQAVPVYQRVNVVETVSSCRRVQSSERHLKWVSGRLRAALVDKVCTRVWLKVNWQISPCPDQCAPFVV
jgi:hypothetical protein